MNDSYIRKRAGVVVLCLLSPIVSHAADDTQTLSEGLTYYCANKNVEFQESVRIDAGTRVSLLHNQAVMQIQSRDQVAPDKNLIKSELLKIGVEGDCAEYLLTQGSSNSTDARVYFNFDRSNLTNESIYVLDTLLKKIQDNSTHLLVKGYTDSIGSKEYNFSLGMRRAESVKGYLVSNKMEADVIKTQSYGETKPIASNATQEGRRQNRRVEITQE